MWIVDYVSHGFRGKVVGQGSEHGLTESGWALLVLDFGLLDIITELRL